MRILVILLLTMAVSLSSCTKGNEGGTESKNSPITFADDSFKAALIALAVDADGDREISRKEAEAVTTLDLEDRADITSLEGIEHFKNLVALSCISTGILTLDVSSNSSLVELDCEDCVRLTYITYNSANQSAAAWYYEVANTQLIDLNPATEVPFADADFGEAVAEIVGKSKVTMSDVLKIKTLDVSSNSEFDSMEDIIYFRSLKNLVCSNTRITSLDVSFLPLLESLNCSNSLLETINVERNAELVSLVCEYTNIETLDVSNCVSLSLLECSDCSSLTTIYIYSGQSITTLSCDEGVVISPKRQ